MTLTKGRELTLRKHDVWGHPQASSRLHPFFSDDCILHFLSLPLISLGGTSSLRTYLSVVD